MGDYPALSPRNDIAVAKFGKENRQTACGFFEGANREYYSRAAGPVTCTRESAAADEPPSRVCGARHASTTEIWWTQETVQWGAQPFLVRNSRWRCSAVYSASGTPG